MAAVRVGKAAERVAAKGLAGAVRVAQRVEPKAQAARAARAGKRAELALREPEGLEEPERLARDREAAEPAGGPAVPEKVKPLAARPAKMRGRRVARMATPARRRE